LILANYGYDKEENKEMLNDYKPVDKIRLKVFSKDVTIRDRKPPKEYQRLMNRYIFDDHRKYLWVGQKCIGFMVSPYNLHTERHEALKLPGHKVIEMRQYHHLNAETLAIIKEDYVNCIIWKVFKILEDTE